MAAFARVSRSALYAKMEKAQAQAEAQVEGKANAQPPETDDANRGAKRKNKPRKWKRLDLNSESPPPPQTIEEFGHNIWDNALPETTDTARGPAPSAPQNPISHLDELKDINTAPSQSQSPAQPQSHRRRRRPRKQVVEMAGTPDDPAYIPPHLRHRKTTPKTDAPKPAGETANTAQAPAVPPSPPATPVKETKMEALRPPKQSRPSQPKFNSRPQWPKQPPAKKYAWPKNRDLRVQPEDDGKVDDGGWGEYESNSGGDPDYDIKKLVDWNGDWMPPPVEWMGRKSFTDRHFPQHIESWALQVDAAYGGGDQYGGIRLPSKTVYQEEEKKHVSMYAGPNGEMASRAWAPMRIEGDSPQQFWRSLPSRAPAPLSDIDLTEVIPWWEAFPDEGTCFISSIEVPEARLDPDDPENHLLGAKSSALQAMDRKFRARQERERRSLEKRNRPVKEVTPPPDMVDKRLKPTANIYIRPVIPADIPQIAALYNHYVRETIKANEFNQRSVSQMNDRVVDIMNRDLPWIVAVHRGNRGRQQQAGETIVGFANIDDYCDVGSMYRFTFEMELYVHADHLHQGIGKCLLDKMLSLVDPLYSSKGGFDWICRGEYLKRGCGRVVKVINFSYPHENGVKDGEIEWFNKFLHDFRFKTAGHLYNIGRKCLKSVDVTIFQYATGEEIPLDSRPVNPL